MAKVLLIDDNLFSLRLYQEMLESIGYQVVIARGGKEGLDKFATTVPDFILCDIMMPEVDGFAVLEKIHTISPQVHFYFISSNIQESNWVRAQKMGASGFIPKPITKEELATILNKTEKEEAEDRTVF